MDFLPLGGRADPNVRHVDFICGSKVTSEAELRVLNLAGVNAGDAGVLALCDAGDEVVLFAPYYFSHLVALQMFGLRPRILPCEAASGVQVLVLAPTRELAMQSDAVCAAAA